MHGFFRLLHHRVFVHFPLFGVVFQISKEFKTLVVIRPDSCREQFRISFKGAAEPSNTYILVPVTNQSGATHYGY